MSVIHPTLAAGRFFSLPLADQLGNVGSEVSRALQAREQGKGEREHAAIDRMLELLDLTIADPKNRGPRLRELCRTREVLCDYFFGDNIYQSTPELLDHYFMVFAVMARSS